MTTCALAIFPSEAGTQVLLQGHHVEAMAPQPFQDLLSRDIARRCLSLDAAITQVEHDAALAGDSARSFSIVRRTDHGDLSCTRVDLVATGGPPVVVLRTS